MLDSYEAITHETFYWELTDQLIGMAHPRAGDAVLDLGCGTGGVARALLDSQPGVTVVGMDPSAELLDIAADELGPRVELVHGAAEELDDHFAPQTFDVVLMGNCAHLFDDIPNAFAQVARVTKPGGRAALSSTFYDNGSDPSDRRFYWQLILQTQRLLAARGVAPARKTGRVAPAKRALSRDYFADSLGAAGFDRVVAQEVSKELGAHIVASMAESPMFADGALPGVPQAEASAALVATVWALDDKHPVSVTRRFLLMAGERTEA